MAIPNRDLVLIQDLSSDYFECDTNGKLVPSCCIPTDLAVTKSVDNSTPTAGDTVTFTITAINNGPEDDSGVVVVDELPSGLVYVSDTSGGSYNPSTGQWTVGPLANGASVSIDIVATVNQDFSGGIINNIATIYGQRPESNLTNNSDNAQLTVTPYQCNVALSGAYECRADSVAFSQADLDAGTGRYTLTLTDPDGDVQAGDAIRLQIPQAGVDVELIVGQDPTLVSGYQNDNGMTTWASFLTYITGSGVMSVAALLAGYSFDWARKTYAIAEAKTWTSAPDYHFIASYMDNGCSAIDDLVLPAQFIKFSYGFSDTMQSAPSHTVRILAGTTHNNVGTANLEVLNKTSASVVSDAPIAINTAQLDIQAIDPFALNIDENWYSEGVIDTGIPNVPTFKVRQDKWSRYDGANLSVLVARLNAAIGPFVPTSECDSQLTVLNGGNPTKSVAAANWTDPAIVNGIFLSPTGSVLVDNVPDFATAPGYPNGSADIELQPNTVTVVKHELESTTSAGEMSYMEGVSLAIQY
jgi:uncharacterized repeat protein (TIGR01451 family)